MYGQEAIAISEAYIDLKNNFSLETICTFFEACWLWPESLNFTKTTLEHLIYVESNSNEVFTRPERMLIKKNQDELYYANIMLQSDDQNYNGRIFFVTIDSSNTIYDSIAIMKLINKVITDGLNVCFFVSPQGLHIGCSMLLNYPDCVLSPIINSKIDWEKLCDLFLYRTDSRELLEYYYGIVSICEEIKECYITSDDDLYRNYYQQNFDSEDYFEDIRHFKFKDYLENIDQDIENDTLYGNRNYLTFDVEEFKHEVDICMHELSFIEKSYVNPLELLFEAEKSLDNSEQQFEESPEVSSIQYEEDTLNLELLNDPIALMKKLKKQHGL